MRTVWLIIAEDWGQPSIVGIFESRELAEVEMPKEPRGERWSYKIEEWPVATQADITPATRTDG